MEIKVVALDIFGTVLVADDADNEMLPRKGLDAFFDKCDSRGIKVASTSDEDLVILKLILQDSGIDLKRFDSFYC